MTDDLLALAERIFTGDEPIESHHPFTSTGQRAEVAPRTLYVDAFANSAIAATDEGLVAVDTSGVFHASAVHKSVREWSTAPLHTAVFTHGHIDHVFGVELYEEEARTQGWAMPRVVAHEALAARFDRYKITAGYNAVINQRQFRVPGLRWPVEYRYPDETFSSTRALDIGGERFELNHDRGETDDSTWVWIPARRVLCTGDLFIWASPNCGNPQKVQRYAPDWAAALRKMAALDAQVLLPGHGLPIVGADRVRRALSEAAELLESLVSQTLALMNEGARLDEVVHQVRAPAHLLERPYLRPIYDEPEFAVRGIWRLYGGWWDLNPATLKPASEKALASELAELAGGATRLADRARELLAAGELRLAGHLAELAALAAPEDPGVHASRAEVYASRAREEASVMAKGVFGWAEQESRERSGT